MKHIFVILALLGFCFAGAAETKEDAQALVKKAVAFYKEKGKGDALTEFSNKTGQFVKGELYLTVWDLKGTQIAHGANEKLIGKNLLELKDADGKEFVKEFMKIQSSGWVDYKWSNPVSRKIELKSVYLEKVDDILIGAGVYTK